MFPGSSMRKMSQLMQCKDGTLDRRNINTMVKKVAMVGEKRKHETSPESSEYYSMSSSSSSPENNDNEHTVKKKKLRIDMVKGEGQYLFNEEGERFLDCAASVTHVGHCNPQIVKAFSDNQHCALSWNGSNVDQNNLDKQQRFLQRLQLHLPKDLKQVVFTNSGSAANGLAIQLSQLVTGGSDVVVFDHTFHGSLSVTSSCSPIMFTSNPGTSASPIAKNWVHVLPVPDLYRGPYRESDPSAVMKYFCDAKMIIESRRAKGAKIACILMEPVFTFQGMSIPEPVYIQELYRYIRSIGALVIIDEVQGGLGRTGKIWGHQNLGIAPDILTCGKPLTSGYPFAIMATSKKLHRHLNRLPDMINKEGLSTGAGLSVFNVLESQSLLTNVKNVGVYLKEGLEAIQARRSFVGKINGMGFMLGVDLVQDKVSREPAPKLASWLLHKMRERKILLAREGEHKNMVAVMPTLCFSRENATHLLQMLEEVLVEAEGIGYELLEEIDYEDRWLFTTSTDDNSYEDMD